MIKLIYFVQDDIERDEYTLMCVYFKNMYELASFDWTKVSLEILSKVSVKPAKKTEVYFIQKGSPLKFMLDKSLDLYQPDYVFYRGLRAPIKFRMPLDGSLAIPIHISYEKTEIRAYEYPEVYLTVKAQESSFSSFYRDAEIKESLFVWRSSFSVREVSEEEIRRHLRRYNTPIFILPSNSHELHGFLED